MKTLAVILMGSRGDLEHAQKIVAPLTGFGVERVNAAILAAKLLGLADPGVRALAIAFQRRAPAKILSDDADLTSGR